MAPVVYSFKHFGAKGSSFETIGTNYKLSNVLSAIGVIQMGKIEKIIEMRNQKAKIYRELLSKIRIKPFVHRDIEVPSALQFVPDVNEQEERVKAA